MFAHFFEERRPAWRGGPVRKNTPDTDAVTIDFLAQSIGDRPKSVLHR